MASRSRSTPPSTSSNIMATRIKLKHPSVLSPQSQVPVMTFSDAINFLKHSTEVLLKSGGKIQSRSVDVCLYDPNGKLLIVYSSDELTLHENMSLSLLIMALQKLVDFALGVDGLTAEVEGEERLAIRCIEVRIFNDENLSGLPRIEGVRGENGEGVMWGEVGGQMERYWEAYRKMMMVVGKDAEGKMISKPMLTVRTIKAGKGVGYEFGIVPGLNNFKGMEQRKVDELRSAERHVRLRGDGEEGEDLVNAIREKILQNDPENRLGITITEIEFATSILSGINHDDTTPPREPNKPRNIFVFDKYFKTLQRGGDLHPELIMKPVRANAQSAPPVNPIKNWGYYQRLGGNPGAHEKYSLDKIPFEVESPVWLHPDDPAYPDVGDDTSTARGHEERKTQMIPYDPYAYLRTSPVPERKNSLPRFTPEAIARYEEQLEAALGFEDDHIFYPGSDRPSRVGSPVKSDASKVPTPAPLHKQIEALRNLASDQILGTPSTRAATTSPYLSAALATPSTAPHSGFYTGMTGVTRSQTLPNLADIMDSPASQNASNTERFYDNTANTYGTPTPPPAMGVDTTQSTLHAAATLYNNTARVHNNSMRLGRSNTTSQSPYSSMTSAHSIPNIQLGTGKTGRSNLSPFLQSSGSAPLQADSPAFKYTPQRRDSMSSFPPLAQSSSQQSQQGGLGQGLMSVLRSTGDINASPVERYKQYSPTKRFSPTKQFFPTKPQYTPGMDFQQSSKYQAPSGLGSLPTRPWAGGVSSFQDLPSTYSFQFSAPNPTSTPRPDNSQIQGQGFSGGLMSGFGSGGANTTQNTPSDFERFLVSGTGPNQDLSTADDQSKTAKPKYTF